MREVRAGIRRAPCGLHGGGRGGGVTDTFTRQSEFTQTGERRWAALARGLTTQALIDKGSGGGGQGLGCKRLRPASRSERWATSLRANQPTSVEMLFLWGLVSSASSGTQHLLAASGRSRQLSPSRGGEGAAERRDRTTGPS